MLLSHGGKVALFDVIPDDKGDAVAGEMHPTDALYVRVDITDSDAVKVAVQRVVDGLGNLKGAVHCAGVAIKREWTNDAADSIPNFKKVRNTHTPFSFSFSFLFC